MTSRHAARTASAPAEAAPAHASSGLQHRTNVGSGGGIGQHGFAQVGLESMNGRRRWRAVNQSDPSCVAIRYVAIRFPRLIPTAAIGGMVKATLGTAR